MMVRVTNSVVARNKHKKILRQASGYYGARSRTYRVAYQSVIKSKQYSYRDRKQKKRIFRQLWINRINAASRKYGLSYSCLINNLHKSSIKINRKMLSELAIFDTAAFLEFVNRVKLSINNVNIEKISNK